MARKPSSLEHYKSILAEIKSPEVKPVYAFFGEETFFADRLQEAAIELIPEEARDFNLDVLYGRDFTVDKLVDICRSYPMMADRRVVVIRDVLQLFEDDDVTREDSNDSTSEDGTVAAGTAPAGGPEVLIAYLENPNPTTTLVLISEKKPAHTTRLGKALKKSKTVTSCTFEKVPDYLLKQWIRDWALSEHKVTFEDSAVELLGYYVGGNLQQLTVEIGKLSTYRNDDGAITDGDVRQVVGLSREYTMFEFSDALTARQTEKAMFIADRLLQTADSAAGEVIKMTGFLYAMFGRIWHIQRLSRKGLTPDQIRESTGISSTFYYDKLVKAGRNFPLSECPAVFEILLDADKAIKGFSKETPEAILLMTVKKLTR